MRSMTIAFPVRCEMAGQIVQTTSRELGEKGIFVFSAELPARRAAAKLRLYFPTGPLDLTATVRSVAGQPPGFWADFDSQDPQIHARILSELAATFEQVVTPAFGVGKFDP